LHLFVGGLTGWSISALDHLADVELTGEGGWIPRKLKMDIATET